MAKVSKEERLKKIVLEREAARKLVDEIDKENEALYEKQERLEEREERAKTHLRKLLAMEVKVGVILEGTRWTIRSNTSGLIITRAASNTPFKNFIRANKDSLEYGRIELGKYRGEEIWMKVNTDWNDKVSSIVIDSGALEDTEIAAWLLEKGAIVTNSDGKRRIREIKSKIAELEEELEGLELVENLAT